MSLPLELPRRAANIFISYRREDSAGHAGRLFDHLRGRFPGRVFMDVDTIEPGIDFVEVIEQAVGCCEVLIVMIGDAWLHATDADGRRRLDNPSDFVRLEIATALERDIRVIPVLVNGAAMPRPEDLPPDLAKLTRRNAIELSDARFSFDVDRLIQAIEAVLQEKAPSALLPAVTVKLPLSADRRRKRARRRAVLAFFVIALLAMTGLTGWLGWRLRERPELRTAAPSAPPAVETPAVETKEPAKPAAKPVPVKVKTAPPPQEPLPPKSDSKARRLWDSAKRKAKAVLDKPASGAEKN
jgi:hypothetical protein